ncbi:NAD(P)-binding domain-containing protein [Crenalkalicoccus roseus]|uniref:NAD(P)-binding domain-containing protein n=1 Tax=Crenalkalicoccus roseus TaxID=1485588 RepID=UPI00107FF3E1
MGATADIGFLGLGRMGAPMAERLLGPEVRLHVFDPRPEAVAPSPRAAPWRTARRRRSPTPPPSCSPACRTAR